MANNEENSNSFFDLDFSNPLAIRKNINDGDNIRDKGLVAPDNIVRYEDIQYGDNSQWNVLDVYHLEGVEEPRPTIVSIHGGGWLYGDKERYSHYCMSLAQRGFTVVNFTYRLVPEFRYPSPVEDINSVFEWIAKNGEKYNIDVNKIFTVGDSAGAQLNSQYLAIFTNPEYQKLFDFTVPNDKIKILGCALNCGMYDMPKQAFSPMSHIFVDHYFDKKDEAQLNQINALNYITDKFPQAFIQTAYYDMLKDEAEPLFELLKSKNVPCELHVYGEETDKHMGHVFHLDFRLEEAKVCNDDECNFFKKILKK